MSGAWPARFGVTLRGPGNAHMELRVVTFGGREGAERIAREVQHHMEPDFELERVEVVELGPVERDGEGLPHLEGRDRVDRSEW